MALSKLPEERKRQGLEKRQYYGKDCLLVRCGSCIYNVSAAPEFTIRQPSKNFSFMYETDFPEYGQQCELVTQWRGYHRGTIVGRIAKGFISGNCDKASPAPCRPVER